MKLNTKRITALILVLLMTSSLLASCSGGGAGDDETSNGEENGMPVYDSYTSKKVDLGLTENETLMDIIEVDGELRATVGVADSLAFSLDGIPYKTEHRYYSMDYVEDTSKREKTVSLQEITSVSDPNVDFVFGGERYPGSGLRYFFFRDGEAFGDPIAYTDSNDSPWDVKKPYNAMAHVMLYEGVGYAGIDYGVMIEGITYNYTWRLYINDHFVDVERWIPGYPDYVFCGLIGIDGVPYGLVRVWEDETVEQVVNTLYEETRLVPLTPETTELPLEGTVIDGLATGGAFSDGKYGYYLCGTELWRTDGKKSSCITDLIFCGVNPTSSIRSVRSLSDGRILVVANGKLIELTGTEEENTEKQVFTAGVINLYGELDLLELTFSKFNDSSDEVLFTVKEYSNKAKLNMALLSGEVDMVISRDQFMLKNYAKQGYLAPLEEVTPEFFGKDVLIENIVDATRLDGVCYYLPRHFTIISQTNIPDYMEEGQSFETRLEYYDFISEKDAEFFKLITKRTIFTLFGQGIDEWVDWNTNTCHFNDGSFEALLEFSNQGSTQSEAEEYAQQVASQPGLGTTSTIHIQDPIPNTLFTDVNEAKAYLKSLREQGGETNPINVRVISPMPSSVHDGYEIFAGHYFAVANNERSRKAAAEFLRWHFLEDVVEEFPKDYNYWLRDGFSINRDETDRFLLRYIDGEVELSVDPELPADVQEYILDEQRLHNSRCGQEQYEKTWELIRDGDHFQYFRNDIFDVMYEEAGRFFSGNSTAEQAAEYVQNRISLYLAEQS